ncbi:BTAD domain-containing putative transcriptional regulator [Glycomyces arizonensis]|uniref:BTAD domain-containing putative transcriptional regulator n=1 Tax=Glycomyces arizonensis TaxID=256035 RepID=UPI0009FE46CB|nr:BTAD domain-containing putative transcriptional regulator [Glycomyces arizonensis]
MKPTMRVEILGPLRVRDDADRTVPVAGARLRSLLTRLALDTGEVVGTGALCRAVWPDGGPDDPGHALQALVSRLRAALPDDAEIRAASGGYRLALPPDAVDVHRFERLARAGRLALEDGRGEDAAPLLREALALWRGEPLADLPDAVAAATRLDELRLAALEDRFAAEMPDRAADSIPELTELTEAHPLRERLHALLIDALRADGRGAEALAAFARIRDRLADRLGADPGPQLREAHLAALRTERPERRGNLKAPINRLIGRDAELAQIAERLDAGRLVTLVGPGGVGKTRLATAVAVDRDSPGGVWTVELAAVTGAGDVAPAAVAALGLRDAAVPREALTRLSEALGAGGTLLVLDNCEHVVDAAAALAADLLGRCPNLSILATGREPLGITGELLVPVLPLDADAAVRLFTERARAVRPDFEPTAPVAELCERLDRLPLAIELAAARLRTMPLDTMMSKLDDRFALLRGGSRTALPRHRTLSAVVAWSWELLTDDEREGAERLAVCAGGFTADAAEHLGAPLESLVDKSLVQFDGGRYRMLETIRQYALVQATDLHQARAAHAAHFLALAEHAAPRLRGSGQLPWLSRLTAERDNLNAAVDFACETGDADTAVRLCAALGHFWAIHGEHGAALTRLLAALALPGSAPPETRTAATAMCLFHALFAGDPDAVLTADPPLRPADPIGKAIHAMLTGDGPPAAEPGTELQDPWKRGMLALIKAMSNGNGGTFEQMHRELIAASAGFGEAGDRWGLASALTYAALATVALGDFTTALKEIDEAAAVAAELGSNDYQRVWRAVIRVSAGEIDRARDELTGIVEAAAGLPAAIAGVTLAELARHDGDHRAAGRYLDGVAERAADDAMLQTMLWDGRGRLAVETGEAREAAAAFARAFDLARRTGDMGLVATVAVGVAMLLLRRGEPVTAAELLGAASLWDLGMSGLDTRRLAERLRAELGESDFTAALQRGERLGRAETLALVEAQTRRW